MTRLHKTLLGLPLIPALIFAGLALAQPGNPPRQLGQRAMAVERVQDSRMLAVNLVRFLNTSEADYKAKEGGYANWEELKNSAYFLANKSRWAQAQGVTIGFGPEIIPGWHLSLVRSANGATYQLMLQNVPDKACMFSFFTNQSGLIYEGQVIGCPGKLVPAHD